MNAAFNIFVSSQKYLSSVEEIMSSAIKCAREERRSAGVTAPLCGRRSGAIENPLQGPEAIAPFDAFEAIPYRRRLPCGLKSFTRFDKEMPSTATHHWLGEPMSCALSLEG